MKKIMLGLAAIALFGFVPNGAFAQAQPPAASAPAAAPAQQLLSPDQLDQLVAPIALYPDTLLSEVLQASTYPLEVVQADRWATANKNLKGDALKNAAGQQDWDDSVKSLTATPSVLSMMSQQLDWTENLGDAVLAQQADVMDAVQRLRTKAQAQNKLQSTSQQTVASQPGPSGNQYITIAPTDPNTVYVPYYDPSVVYGAWPYPSYPPYYFPPPSGYFAGAAIATGIAFGVGYAVGRWATGGGYWGGGFNWGGNNITVNRSINNNININNNNWQHNAAHRRGVPYTNANVQNRFGNNTIRNGSQNRMDFRGRNGNQVLNPGGGNRPNIGGGGGIAPISAAAEAVPMLVAAETVPMLVAVAIAPILVAAAGPEAEVSRVALQPSAISAQAVPPISNRNAAGRVSAVVVVVVPGWEEAVAAVELAAAGAGPVPAEEAEAAAVVAAVGAAPISGSSTTSSCSAVSTTVSGSIALLITGATSLTSASWRKKCSRSCPKPSWSAATVT